MRKNLYTLSLLAMVLFSASVVRAQIGGMHVLDGLPWHPENDSTVFTFLSDDSLTHFYTGQDLTIDTGNSGLWQVGSTVKAYFADSGSFTAGIMTDTAGFYTVYANDGFIIGPITNSWYPNMNTIIGFEHKFQTSAGLDGGIVEFSADSGATWQNVMGDCNHDESEWFNGILTDSFYSHTDTLWNGEAGFSGNSNGWLHSRFQLFYTLPLKGAATECPMLGSFLVRFRFVSDSIPDSLAGWLIGNIKIENDYYGSSVAKAGAPALQVRPNPSHGMFYFPELPGSTSFNLSVFNSSGQRVLHLPYQKEINLGHLPAGLFFYQVTNGTAIYSGKLQKE